MGDISRNFSYDEFKVSVSYPQVAAAMELTQLDKLKVFWLTHLFLQPIRDAINNGSSEEVPVTVSSGIRRGELNGLVGGVAHSDHLYNQFSAAVDIKIGEELVSKYWDIIFRVCRRKKEYVKQLIYYLPSAGNFIHLSSRDKTTKIWQRLYCASRENRRYFDSLHEAEEWQRYGT